MRVTLQLSWSIKLINHVDVHVHVGVLLGRSEREQQPAVDDDGSELTDNVVAVGDVAAGVLKRVSLSLAVNLETMEAVALLDRKAK